jgi:hypothetical protein
MSENWSSVNPKVNIEAEFLEIINDFSDPLEIVREAISNSIDSGASEIRITFRVDDDVLIIEFEDDGNGMSSDDLEAFWGLGFSTAREVKNQNPEKRLEIIGEKGHGTKIFLRSTRVHVITYHSSGIYESVCDEPLKNLISGRVHEPKTRRIESDSSSRKGTKITISGYNRNQRSKFSQVTVKDYILWFTKVGSIELMFDIDRLKNFRVYLKCLDHHKDHEIVNFGHVFPDENSDIDAIFNEHGENAADLYVKYFKKEGSLHDYPEIQYQIFISVEGDEAKRKYNKLIRQRLKKGGEGQYRVSDRYGIWLCKDYIPVTRVNEWVRGFGTGSNSVTLLHGFVNCQALKLTANRGTVANTNPDILYALEMAVADMLEEIDLFIMKKDIYTLKELQEEVVTSRKEEADWHARTKRFPNRNSARIASKDGSNIFQILEPSNEAELFALYMLVYAIYGKEMFDFSPVDYNTHRGIDMIVSNSDTNIILEGQYSYLELKHTLGLEINHGFKNLRYIMCWDFAKAITNNAIVNSTVDNANSEWRLEVVLPEDQNSKITRYFLVSRVKRHKIEIIRLKELLDSGFGIKFDRK